VAARRWERSRTAPRPGEPSIRFYRSIGAVGIDEWKLQRLSGDALTRLATG